MASTSPSTSSHLIALLMPATMVIVVPVIILRGQLPDTNPGLLVLGGMLCGVGLALFIATLRLFIVVGRGTLAPWNPTQKLVVLGPYRYVRNPMITAVFTILLAEAVTFWSWSLLVWAVSFFAFNTLYFIFKEEPDLERKFGAAYRHYKHNVPRWIPRWTPYNTN